MNNMKISMERQIARKRSIIIASSISNYFGFVDALKKDNM